MGAKAVPMRATPTMLTDAAMTTAGPQRSTARPLKDMTGNEATSPVVRAAPSAAGESAKAAWSSARSTSQVPKMTPKKPKVLRTRRSVRRSCRGELVAELSISVRAPDRMSQR